MERTIYSKYSNERAARFAIRTDIVQDENGRKRVYKYAQCGEADAHIAGIADAYQRLTKAYAGGKGEEAGRGIRFCPCRLCPLEETPQSRETGSSDSQKPQNGEPGQRADRPAGAVRAEFPFLRGATLQELLEEAAGRGDRARVERILREYVRRIGTAGGEVPFRVTEQFREVFGDQAPEEGLPCAGVSDIDLIFPNILLPGREGAPGNDRAFGEGAPGGENASWDEEPARAGASWDDQSAGDGEPARAGASWDDQAIGDGVSGVWEVIDYEWTFGFPVPREFILYRALYFAYYQGLYDAQWSLQELYALAGITERAAAVYAGMEEHFQDYIRSGALPVRNMQRSMGTRATALADLLRGGTEAGSAIVPESEWIRVRRIQYHIDRQECQDNSMICSGWAFVRVWDGRILPARIAVVDETGHEIPAEISRRERPDVAKAYKLRRVTAPLFGFDCVWPKTGSGGVRLRFSMGKREEYHDIAAGTKHFGKTT